MKFPARQRAIVAAIAEAREAAGLSQRQLAAKLGEPSNWIQRIESLERRWTWPNSWLSPRPLEPTRSSSFVRHSDELDRNCDGANLTPTGLRSHGKSRR